MQVSEREKERYLSLKGNGGKRILHWEHWSNPDAETYLTGIDYYERPRDCRLRLRELYPMLELPIPETNEPTILCAGATVKQPPLSTAKSFSKRRRMYTPSTRCSTPTSAHGNLW